MPTFTRAISADRATLTAMMREFYAGEHLAFSDSTAAALEQLLAAPAFGHACLIRDESSAPVGYLILTFTFSLERGGKTALLDELYLRPEAREKGLGKAALAYAFALAQSENCKAILLEVDHANAAAQSLYAQSGFQKLARHLMVQRTPTRGS